MTLKKTYNISKRMLPITSLFSALLRDRCGCWFHKVHSENLYTPENTKSRGGGGTSRPFQACYSGKLLQVILKETHDAVARILSQLQTEYTSTPKGFPRNCSSVQSQPNRINTELILL